MRRVAQGVLGGSTGRWAAQRTSAVHSRMAVRAFSSSWDVDHFGPRHIGPREEEQKVMLKELGFENLEQLADSIVPSEIRGGIKELSGVPDAASESAATAELRAIADENKVLRSMIGMGYHGTKTPSPILRNILCNPAWYTAYTPYQAEISQGRLEMLLNFQTMVSSLTSMDIANCSLLDEGSSAAEAMNMCHAISRGKRSKFFVSETCHPQTIACVETRGQWFGVEVVVGKPESLLEDGTDLSEFSGVLVQYPDTLGSVSGDYQELADALHGAKSRLVMATDLLACTMIKPPGEYGADIVIGSSQRFGVPMFYGGPHAAYMAVKDELKRLMPGRLIGVSKDSQGKRALRMALQTREQFIRREKATSNICTAQALLANVAAAYGVYHGPDGLKKIANGVHNAAKYIASAVSELGLTLVHDKNFFDTICVTNVDSDKVLRAAVEKGINLRRVDATTVGISVDETTTRGDAEVLIEAIASATGASDDSKAKALAALQGQAENLSSSLDQPRTSTFMEHTVFSKYQSETELLRYLSGLERRDITLRESMIPLGSCTMKLNAASELLPITWPEFADMHPFCPKDQAQGYEKLIGSLNAWLSSLTGFAAVSTQPNSGATGEYAGLLCIQNYHASRGESHRDVCLIPNSAHGTNPASAVMCGMKVVGVKNDSNGNVDMEDFKAKVEKHGDRLAALMITYPSTYGKFERGIDTICEMIHEKGGQVYMDGANMNAQLGLSSPGAIGADVCHLNLHKTFAIPHGGGGPGVGSIGVAEHLAPFLPGHVVIPAGGEGSNTEDKLTGQVAAAPYGSAGILPISWMYIRMMGAQGMLDTSRVAMLNANYIAKRLEHKFKILFRGDNGQCAHEFIMDFSYLKKHGLTETDVAKRLCDYGFHAPTTSWPVHFSLMVEPTESESKAECDRLVEAFLSIQKEIEDVIEGRADKENNVLVNAPHTAEMLAGDWPYPYTREQAAFPLPSINNMSKFWPTVSRIDNVAGDRVLICSCESVEELESKDI